MVTNVYDDVETDMDKSDDMEVWQMTQQFWIMWHLQGMLLMMWMVMWSLMWQIIDDMTNCMDDDIVSIVYVSDEVA